MSATYVVDKDAVARAGAFLGLLLPIRVRRCKLLAYGQYGYIRNGYHRITLNREVGPEQASRTLWHELIHALQTERNGNDAWAFDRAYRAGLPPEPPRDEFRSEAWQAWFDANPYEQEAMAAYAHHDWLPLTVAV